MITFHVLGTLDLRGPDGGHLGSPLSGSKRLALLSYLALATPRALHRRDTLLALLWPESDDARARNALSNMVYQIRRSLGRESLVSAGDDEIGLTRGALWCDAVAFEEALDEGHPEEALELYRGDLLDGFFVSGAAAEFDHWLDAERARLRRRAADAARTLADRAEQAEDWNEATRWARRTLTFDRYDEQSARRLISLLDGAGDRAGALRAYDSLADLLGREFQAEPAAETRTLIQAVRGRSKLRDPAEPDAGSRGVSPDPSTVQVAGAVPPDASAELPVRAIAVLPFDNLSGREDAEPFAAGLHDDLLTELSRISALTVISRTSVLRYRGASMPIQQIARELGVGTVVEAGVQSSNGRLRLNVQLIDGRSGAHCWVERYDRALSAASIFDIQSDLVERIAGSLRAELSPMEKAGIRGKPTRDLDAYRFHAEARRHLDERTEDGMRRALDYFRRALDQDPNYAWAQVGLADVFVDLHCYGYEEADSVLPRAEEAIRRAMEIEPDLPDAHVSLAYLRFVRREGSAAIREMQRGIALSPGNAQAHSWMSWMQQLVGRPGEALESAKCAVELNPLSPEAIVNLSFSSLINGMREQALTEARREHELGSSWGTGRFYEGLALYELKRFEEAKSVLAGLAAPWSGEGPRATLALAHAAAGERSAARRFLLEIEEASDSFAVGLVHAALGEQERAFNAFEKLERWGYWPTLAIRHLYRETWDPVREDPRYEALFRAMQRSWGFETGERLMPRP